MSKIKSQLQIIVNPIANRGKSKSLFKEFTSLMDERGIKYKYHFTEYPGHATLISDKITSGKGEILLIFGGDGTYNEVENGCFGKDVIIGHIPAGSCNDFTRELGEWSGLNSFLDSVKNNNTMLIDAGIVNDRLFLTNVGAGFDAQIIHDMNKRNMKGNLGYVLMVFKNLYEFECFKANIETYEKKLNLDLLMLTVNNATTYGGGFKIAPAADVKDGMLDICLITSISKPKFIANFPKVYSGTHLKIDEVIYWKTKKVNIKLDRKLPIQVDGELLPDKLDELIVDVIPDAFRVFKY
jgi:YegS/Rv2252/BmrU family lipid kinase